MPRMADFNKLRSWLKIQAAARRLRVPFTRRATFSPPDQIAVGGTFRPLSFPRDEGVKWDFLGVILADEYRLRQIVGPPSRIIDIGGNVGFFSVAARLTFPDSVIHCYEPNPALLPYLSHQGRQFNFECFGEAAGANSGFVAMSFDRGSDTNLGRVEDVDAGQIVKIPLEKAVARIGGTVDLLKLDCEGAEWEMFRKAQCWEKIQRITMEYHLFDQQTHFDFREMVTRLGYKLDWWRYSDDCHYGHAGLVRY